MASSRGFTQGAILEEANRSVGAEARGTGLAAKRVRIASMKISENSWNGGSFLRSIIPTSPFRQRCAKGPLNVSSDPLIRQARIIAIPPDAMPRLVPMAASTLGESYRSLPLQLALRRFILRFLLGGFLLRPPFPHGSLMCTSLRVVFPLMLGGDLIELLTVW